MSKITTRRIDKNAVALVDETGARVAILTRESAVAPWRTSKAPGRPFSSPSAAAKYFSR